MAENTETDSNNSSKGIDVTPQIQKSASSSEEPKKYTRREAILGGSAIVAFVAGLALGPYITPFDAQKDRQLKELKEKNDAYNQTLTQNKDFIMSQNNTIIANQNKIDQLSTNLKKLAENRLPVYVIDYSVRDGKSIRDMTRRGIESEKIATNRFLSVNGKDSQDKYIEAYMSGAESQLDVFGLPRSNAKYSLLAEENLKDPRRIGEMIEGLQTLKGRITNPTPEYIAIQDATGMLNVNLVSIIGKIKDGGSRPFLDVNPAMTLTAEYDTILNEAKAANGAIGSLSTMFAINPPLQDAGKFYERQLSNQIAIANLAKKKGLEYFVNTVIQHNGNGYDRDRFATYAQNLRIVFGKDVKHSVNSLNEPVNGSASPYDGLDVLKNELFSS